MKSETEIRAEIARWTELRGHHPDMHTKEWPRECDGRIAALEWVLSDIPLPDRQPDPRDAAMEKAREALGPFANIEFSFDGYSMDAAEVIIAGINVGRVSSTNHARLEAKVKAARDALVAIDVALKGPTP